MKGLGTFLLAFLCIFLWLVFINFASNPPSTSQNTGTQEAASVSTVSSSESSQAKITKRRFGIPSGPYVPSDIDSKTTDDPKAVSSFQLAGVWGILHPADTDAELVWLHDDGRFTMRRGNCGILVQGKWEQECQL